MSLGFTSTDLKQGNNKLDFHAVAFTPQFDDRKQFEEIQTAMKATNPPMTMEGLTNTVMKQAIGNPAKPINDIKGPVTIQIKIHIIIISTTSRFSFCICHFTFNKIALC